MSHAGGAPGRSDAGATSRGTIRFGYQITNVTMTMPIAHQPVTDFAYVIENHMIGKIGLMELELTPRARFGRAITAYIDRFGGPAMPTVCGLDDRPAEVAAVLEWAVARGKPASSRELWLEVVGKPPPQPGDVLV